VNNCRFSGKNLQQWVKNLPIGHLQLGRHALPERESSSTIGEMMEAVERGVLRHSSATAARRIERTLDALVRTLGDGRPGNWDRFRNTRPPLRSYKAIYFASPRLRALSGDEKRLALAKLHLSRRALNALNQGGITVIGELIRQAEKGIINLEGLGEFKALEIITHLEALSDAARSDGSIDWPTFARLCKFAVLPEEASEPTPQDFVRRFPSLCITAVSSSFAKKASTVLKTRLLRSAKGNFSLRALGKHLGQNRETLRLHENEVIETLRSAIWDEEYCGCRFRFRRDFLTPLHQLRTMVETRTAKMSWETVLRDAWGVDREAVSGQEILLLRLLGRDVEWARQELLSQMQAKTEIQRFIRANRTRPFAAIQVWQHLDTKLGAIVPSLEEVITILEGLPILERTAEKHSFMVRFNELSYTDRLEVLLRARNSPMHVRDLTSAIRQGGGNSAKSRDPQLTASLLWESPRFTAIGKTGYWALSEWRDIETRIITTLAADLLASSPEPLHEFALFRLIKACRPVAYESIGSLLGHDGRFVRVAPRTWKLKKRSS
jgi:Bacterial RNA polymerase, alpha chain C terminal domain